MWIRVIRGKGFRFMHPVIRPRFELEHYISEVIQWVDAYNRASWTLDAQKQSVNPSFSLRASDRKRPPSLALRRVRRI